MARRAGARLPVGSRRPVELRRRHRPRPPFVLTAPVAAAVRALRAAVNGGAKRLLLPPTVVVFLVQRRGSAVARPRPFAAALVVGAPSRPARRAAVAMVGAETARPPKARGVGGRRLAVARNPPLLSAHRAATLKVRRRPVGSDSLAVLGARV